ncbi:hypothetical protein BOQ62_14255 [Chryseobacterium sp. CH21]|uniref:hypothetical protein n=1 Tax=Chryseobacterium sp. CH21 TaxID=713556 RepID=UPI00100AA72A|nr:hypothetical protein [Chryseobacterium sp. CH21]RXM38962.1 hypothetical protein BOQ62_14255 [Chryseobacterium sp. CH21]
MKKLLLLLVAGGGFLSAQKIEISASYGVPSLYGVANDIGTSIVNGLILPNEKTPTSMGVAVIGVAVYSNNNKWRYGVDVTNEFFTKIESVPQKNIFSVLPKVDYFWFNREKFRMYSGVAAGVTFNSHKYNLKDQKETKSTDTIFGFNVLPIGFRYGGDFGVFLETNLGMKGFVQGGVSYKF